jgi:4-diphosphocytidyl-2-C-methyl-D-erythritol kinase
VPGVAEVDDLLVRAAILLKNEAKITEGVDIGIEKRIPAGGGFGGGSSDAATVLVALNALWGCALGEDQLASLGLRLGADVPVFVRGENAWAEGVGEVLTPLALSAAWYLLVDPGVHVPTASLFASPDLTRDAAPAKISDFVSGSLLGNVFEPVVRRREPAIEAVFQALSQIGAPRLTGSGGGCFVEFADRTSAEAALASLPAGLHAWVVEGAARSPLLDALAQVRGTEKYA